MIATALGTGPRVLLLDEPSAGIGAAELGRIADAILRLRERGLGLLVVEHNLRLVRTIADRVIVLDAAVRSPRALRRRSAPIPTCAPRTSGGARSDRLHSPAMKALAAAAAIAVTFALAGCGGNKSATSGRADRGRRSVLEAVGARREHRARRRAGREQMNQGDGIPVGTDRLHVKVKRYDNALSPRIAVANIRHAIADGAVAIVDEGTGVDASWERAKGGRHADRIVYQGAASLVDPKKRPNVFRIVPTDHGIAFRFAEYSPRST